MWSASDEPDAALKVDNMAKAVVTQKLKMVSMQARDVVSEGDGDQ